MCWRWRAADDANGGDSLVRGDSGGAGGWGVRADGCADCVGDGSAGDDAKCCGEGVAIGLGLAFRLSARLGHCAPGDADRVVSHIAAMGMPAELRMLNRRLSAATLIGHMRRDKKVRDGALKFVLARGIGQTFTAGDVPPEAVTDLLRDEGCDV